MYMYVYVCIYVCICIFMYVYVCICMYVYVCIISGCICLSPKNGRQEMIEVGNTTEHKTGHGRGHTEAREERKSITTYQTNSFFKTCPPFDHFSCCGEGRKGKEREAKFASVTSPVCLIILSDFSVWKEVNKRD